MTNTLVDSFLFILMYSHNSDIDDMSQFALNYDMSHIVVVIFSDL